MPIPFDTVQIDHLELFMRSISKNFYLLVLVDSFTQFVIAKPTWTLKPRETEARLREIFRENGYPKRINNDSGLTFTSKKFGEFLA